MADRTGDVQSTRPEFPIRLNKVGLVNVVKEVVFNGSSKPYNVIASIDVFTDLPATQRGMHMSRPGEAITDIIEDISSVPIKTFEALCEEISKRTLEVSESCNYAKTTLKGKMVLRTRSKINDRVVAEPVNVYAGSKVNRSASGHGYKSIHYVGVKVSGMTVCPCAKEMVADYSKDLVGGILSKYNIPEKDIEALYSSIPFASHVQRGDGMVVACGVKPGSVDIYELVDLVEDAMSSPVQLVLKRADEASLVRRAFSRPRFVEDVVRSMAEAAARKYGQKVDRDALFLFKQTNYESIHKHDVRAELKIRMGDLLDLVSGPNRQTQLPP
ncbi:MAG: GTP cyclohydrolase MptA [Thermoprotei archaeon]